MTPNDDEDVFVTTDRMSSDATSDADSAIVAELAPRKFHMSILLNADDDDVEMQEDGNPDAAVQPLCTNTQQLVKVPKKRGRKQILPKMNNSERGKYYRNKRKVHSMTLEREVEMLRATVTRMAALRAIREELNVCPRATLSGSLVKLVYEYFEQFRHGVQLPPARRNMLLPDVETSTSQQQLFMEATMVPDLGFGEFTGIDVIMDQWERYSKYHAFLQFELLKVKVTENASGAVVETEGQLRTRYSRKTIENVFPHVVGNEALIQRLIGKEVVYPCRNQFYFTPEGRVHRYDVEADFPEALQRAIGNLDDVAILLGQALIRQDHMMGELADEEMAIIEQVEYLSSSSEDGSRSHKSDHRVPVNSPSRMEMDFLLNEVEAE